MCKQVLDLRDLYVVEKPFYDNLETLFYLKTKKKKI